MSAQQKYLYQYAYLDGSSFNAVENNNLYNDERGGSEMITEIADLRAEIKESLIYKN